MLYTWTTRLQKAIRRSVCVDCARSKKSMAHDVLPDIIFAWEVRRVSSMDIVEPCEKLGVMPLHFIEILGIARVVGHRTPVLVRYQLLCKAGGADGRLWPRPDALRVFLRHRGRELHEW